MQTAYEDSEESAGILTCQFQTGSEQGGEDSDASFIQRGSIVSKGNPESPLGGEEIELSQDWATDGETVEKKEYSGSFGASDEGKEYCFYLSS